MTTARLIAAILRPRSAIAILSVGLLIGVRSKGQVSAQAAIDVTASVRYVDPTGKAPKERHSADDTNRRTVLWLLPVDPAQLTAPHPTTYTMLQRGKQFHPDLMIVPVGSKVSFPNADPFFHNVFSLFNGRRFDLGLYQSGQSREVDFNRAGVSYIFCNIHPEMTAVIISLKTPYYASPEATGITTMRHVPEGNYTLEVWSELTSPDELGKLTKAITISRKNTDLGEIDIPVSSSGLSDHLNKFGLPYDTHTPDKAY